MIDLETWLFDDWRRNYDGMSYADQVAFYELIGKKYPRQICFDAGAYGRFFEYVLILKDAEPKRSIRPSVLEIGGWNGELAQAMLERYADIAAWHNIEIRASAAETAVCQSERYRVVDAGDFAWRVALPEAEVFVASHVIEHIRAHELAALLDNLPASVRFVGLQAPLGEEGRDWSGYLGSHILEIGWWMVEALLKKRGFRHLIELSTGEFRAFERGGEMKTASLGVAMIARNGAKTMRVALDAFVGLVDEIAIVLGGVSTDATRVVAEEYTSNVKQYAGPLDEEGRLLDFGAARQQAFDALSTDWAVVVDTDDCWSGEERLRELIEYAERDGAAFISVPYQVQGLEMYQPRMYRRDAGHWEMPVHEYFEIDEGRRHGLKTAWLRLQQVERPQEANLGRIEQNIQIAERWLIEHGENRHILAHLAKDYVSAGRYEDGMRTADRYLELRQKSNETGYRDELSSVLYHQAGVLLMLGRFDAALHAALATLSVHDEARDAGPGWALLAEIFYEFSGGKAALCELAVFAADRALAAGRARGGFAKDNLMSLAGALCIKAEALEALGRLGEARGALDLGLLIDPQHEQMRRQIQRVSEKLNELA